MLTRQCLKYMACINFTGAWCSSLRPQNIPPPPPPPPALHMVFSQTLLKGHACRSCSFGKHEPHLINLILCLCLQDVSVAPESYCTSSILDMQDRRDGMPVQLSNLCNRQRAGTSRHAHIRQAKSVRRCSHPCTPMAASKWQLQKHHGHCQPMPL